jgi:hypothetical protein
MLSQDSIYGEPDRGTGLPSIPKILPSESDQSIPSYSDDHVGVDQQPPLLRAQTQSDPGEIPGLHYESSPKEAETDLSSYDIGG